MPRKPSKKTLKTKLDKAWGSVIRERASNCCEVCKGRGYINAHHVVGRRNLRLRWELYNGVALCAGCHTFKLDSAHQNPEWFHYWLEDNRGEDLQSVNDTMSEIKKWSIGELQDRLEELTQLTNNCHEGV